MTQLELIHTHDDDRIKKLTNAIQQEPFWSPFSVDKIEEAGKMFRVLPQTVIQCFEQVYASSNDPKSVKYNAPPQC